MKTLNISTQVLDTILSLQFTLAWAGEGLSQPARLNWWRTDLIDEYGGGDFMQRLAPRTHRWAGLEAARQAGILIDAKARRQMADPDRVRTLFFWGFEVNELLDERIRALKWGMKEPSKALSLPISLEGDFNGDQLEASLQSLGQETSYTVQMSGRELKGDFPQDHEEAARILMRAMLPLADHYPAPFFRV